MQCLKGGACPAPRWRQDECYMGLSVKLVTCTRNVYQAYLSEASMDSILESKLETRSYKVDPTESSLLLSTSG